MNVALVSTVKEYSIKNNRSLSRVFNGQPPVLSPSPLSMNPSYRHSYYYPLMLTRNYSGDCLSGWLTVGP